MKKKGFTLIELLVVIAIIAMLLSILMPALGKVKELAQRLICGTNLKGLGTSIHMYAADYEDEAPLSGGGGINSWSTTGVIAGNKWDNPNADWSDDDEMTVSSCLYLLIREVDMDPKLFVCKSGNETVFGGKVENEPDLDFVQLWDFGGPDADGDEPEDTCSYAYHMAFEPSGGGRSYRIPSAASSSYAILADRSPWFDNDLPNVEAPSAENIDSTVYQIGNPENDWDDTSKTLKKHEKNINNSAAHKREGQNVCFGDGHVTFEKRPDVGIRNDNIYSPDPGGAGGTETQRRGGLLVSNKGLGGGLPQHKNDSYLVNDVDVER